MAPARKVANPAPTLPMMGPLTKPQKATLLEILRRESHLTHLIEVGVDREDFVELHMSTIERLMAEAFLAGVEEAKERRVGFGKTG